MPTLRAGPMPELGARRPTSGRESSRRGSRRKSRPSRRGKFAHRVSLAPRSARGARAGCRSRPRRHPHARPPAVAPGRCCQTPESRRSWQGPERASVKCGARVLRFSASSNPRKNNSRGAISAKSFRQTPPTLHGRSLCRLTQGEPWPRAPSPAHPSANSDSGFSPQPHSS
jgi:hypothetical protein